MSGSLGRRSGGCNVFQCNHVFHATRLRQSFRSVGRRYASEEGSSFKGQLYESTHQRLLRERAEQARFAEVREARKGASGSATWVVPFGNSTSSFKDPKYLKELINHPLQSFYLVSLVAICLVVRRPLSLRPPPPHPCRPPFLLNTTPPLPISKLPGQTSATSLVPRTSQPSLLISHPTPVPNGAPIHLCRAIAHSAS